MFCSGTLLAAAIMQTWIIQSCSGLPDDVTSTNSKAKLHRPKLLNAFSVVRFPNGACIGTSTNGTCYTSAECATRGGSASTSCAGGYGVCCTFGFGCGKTSYENCTYFQSVGNEVGACSLRICPCNDNICQLRLDFNMFVINQPSTLAITVTRINAAKAATVASQCLIDQFKVTNPGKTAPPTICGTTTGEHMYVDAFDLCNVLTMNLGSVGSLITRSWNIKITQYSCNYNNLAPPGCTQYFYGRSTGTVKTFNFDGGMHLADQDQNICVRTERSTCQICWSQAANTDFEVSTGKAGASGTAKVSSKCCGYGTDFSDTAVGYDCAMIPKASKTDGTIILKGASNGFCGGRLGTAGTTALTVCSKMVPFSISFLSDHYEWAAKAAKAQNGFRLNYQIKKC